MYPSAFHNKISVANLFILIMGFPNVPKSPVWTDIRGKMPALCLYFSDFAHFCESESGYSGESVNLVILGIMVNLMILANLLIPVNLAILLNLVNVLILVNLVDLAILANLVILVNLAILEVLVVLVILVAIVSAVLPSRPYLYGHARIYGHFGKIARISPVFL